MQKLELKIINHDSTQNELVHEIDCMITSVYIIIADITYGTLFEKSSLSDSCRPLLDLYMKFRMLNVSVLIAS